MDQVEKSALFDQFHDKAELWRDSDGPEHEYDVGMAILGKHIDLVIELIEQFFADVGIEDLLYCHVDIIVLPFVDGTKSSHGYLLTYLQIAHPNDQYSVY